MPAPRSFWDHQPIRPAATAHRLWVGDTAVLFDDGSQQLFELNDSSAAIWDALCSEGTPAAAARTLAPAEDDYPIALDHVRAATAGWLRMGLVRPAALDQARSPPLHQVRLQWMGCCVSLDVWDAAAGEALSKVFSAFVSDGPPTHRLRVERIGDLVFICDDHGRTCARAPDEWIPEVKARFTAKILDTATPGFLAHAALLSRRGQGVLICGAPGAGKTTLSVSLTLAGFDYCADDIVWIGEGGDAVGAPFAPALKEGTWPLAAAMGADVAACPTYLRGDGQPVRYLEAPSVPREPVRLGAILLVERSASERARIEPLEPLDVLTAILGSAYSTQAALSAAALKGLVGAVEQARLGRLRFADWRDGRRLIDEFAP